MADSDTSDAAEEVRHRAEELKWMGNRAPFALSSPLKHAAIKLSCLMFDAKRVPGFSLLVRFNGGRTLLLLMNRRRRRSSGLYRIRDNVTVGDVSFEHAAVAVSDKKFLTDVDGLIGLDVFSMFLVTVDFQKMVLMLAPGWGAYNPGDMGVSSGTLPALRRQA